MYNSLYVKISMYFFACMEENASKYKIILTIFKNVVSFEILSFRGKNYLPFFLESLTTHVLFMYPFIYLFIFVYVYFVGMCLS